MKKIFLLILYILVFVRIVKCQEGWFTLFTEQNTTVTYTGMQFFNGQTGYLTTSWGNEHNNGGATSKTTNGGVNWFSVEGSVARYGLFFLNEQTGWTFGGYWDDAGKRSREIFRTTNGGQNFTRLYIDSLQNSFSKMFFADFNTGWVTTYNGILKTTNSGINWFECAALYIRPLYFTDVNTGWSANYPGYVYKTTNGGINWSIQMYNESAAYSEILFKDQNIGWICGNSDYVYKTTNSGENWIAYNTWLSVSLSSIEFYNYNKGWACGDSGKIIYTTNGGLNWTLQNTAVNYYFNHLSFADEYTGYVVGIILSTPYSHDNILMKTTTGGITFVQNINSEIPINFSLSQNYPNPFNPVTKIKFDISPSKGARGMTTKLIIYDILGREIAELVNEHLKPGTYEVEWNGTNHPSGVYFYKLTTADYTETKKMVLVK